MNAAQAEYRSRGPIYVYAIVRSGRNGQSPIAGIETLAGGIGTIGEGRYSAVVGNGRVENLHGQPREELGRLLLAHQQVIEQLRGAATVLPVKFGTQAPDEMAVRKALARGGQLFETAFAELEGCTQLEILVTRDLDAVFADIAMEEPIARLKAKIAENAGAVPLADRAGLGKLVKDALEQRRVVCAERLSEALRAVAIDTVVYPVVADRIVLQVALLVKTNAMEAMDRCLETLDAEFGGRLSFRCVGPMAPTCFATVEIEFLEAGEIAQASRTLGVDWTASAADVRTAYHRLARTAHPDAADALDDGAEAMLALTKAYKLLSRHAHAREPDRTSDERFCLDPTTAHAVLVSVRRPDAASGGAQINGRA